MSTCGRNTSINCRFYDHNFLKRGFAKREYRVTRNFGELAHDATEVHTLISKRSWAHSPSMRADLFTHAHMHYRKNNKLHDASRSIRTCTSKKEKLTTQARALESSQRPSAQRTRFARISSKQLMTSGKREIKCSRRYRR